MEDRVNIEEEYDKQGFLVRMTVNGIDLPIPVQDTPQVKIIENSGIDWSKVDSISTKKYMTREEVKERFGKEFL